MGKINVKVSLNPLKNNNVFEADVNFTDRGKINRFVRSVRRHYKQGVKIEITHIENES